MRRCAFWLPVLLMAGCASAPGAPAVVHAAAPSDPSASSTATIPPPQVAPPAGSREVPAGLPRQKSFASGATMLEESLPALGSAQARFSAEPTVRHEVDLAQALREAGILDQAYDHFAAAARREPREAAAWDGLARVWRDWGYPGLALGDAHRAVFADPGSPVVRNTLGTILQLLGRIDQAREQFDRAVALEPGAGYAHYNVGVACMAQRQYAAAADAFERAAALDASLDARVRASVARQRALESAPGKDGLHERR